jgi:hypothetical protein
MSQSTIVAAEVAGSGMIPERVAAGSSAFRRKRIARRLSAGSDALLVVLFLAGLAVPFAGRWFGLPSGFDRDFEKREPAPAPSLDFTWKDLLQNLPVFARNFENYLNDSLAFRSSLIRLHSIVETCWLGDSSCDRVVMGRGGWLYYHGGTADNSDDISDYRGSKPLTDSQVQYLRGEFLQRRDELARMGIRYIVLVCPNKPVIYPEFLPPAFASKVTAQSPLQQLKAAMQSDDLAIVDPSEALLRFKAAHPDIPLYFKTDTHWTQAGAFVAYQQLCAAARQMFPKVEPLTEQDVTMQIVRRKGGDLAEMMGIENHFSDLAVEISPRIQVDFDINYDSENLIPSVNSDPTLPRLYMLRDSFASAMTELIPRHFSHVLFVRNMPFDLHRIADDHPDLVVDEIVERRIRLWAQQDTADNCIEPDPRDYLAMDPAATQPTTAPVVLPSDDINGGIDSNDNINIYGFVWDKDRGDLRIVVAFYIDGRYAGVTTADRYREDLASAGIGDGRHAFFVRLPSILSDGQPHSLVLKIAGTDIQIGGPTPSAPPPPPAATEPTTSPAESTTNPAPPATSQP